MEMDHTAREHALQYFKQSNDSYCDFLSTASMGFVYSLILS